jgi:RNase P/RNase MRP subunit p29
MITDDQLDKYRLEGTKVRVIRDSEPANDVKGTVMAWDDQSVLIRKQNRKVLKVNRTYTFQPLDEERRFEL